MSKFGNRRYPAHTQNNRYGSFLCCTAHTLLCFEFVCMLVVFGVHTNLGSCASLTYINIQYYFCVVDSFSLNSAHYIFVRNSGSKPYWNCSIVLYMDACALYTFDEYSLSLGFIVVQQNELMLCFGWVIMVVVVVIYAAGEPHWRIKFSANWNKTNSFIHFQFQCQFNRFRCVVLNLNEIAWQTRRKHNNIIEHTVRIQGSENFRGNTICCAISCL